MEAIRRLNIRITHIDFRARMPSSVTTVTCQDAKPLYGLTTIGMRMTRFRLENAVPAWDARPGSEKIKDYIWQRMSPEARLANSTEELESLTKAEQEEAQAPSKGKFPWKARAQGRTA